MTVRLRYALAVVVALGGALRFATLDGRSFWRDEIFTVELVRRGFGTMLVQIPDSEGTPPVYYALGWGWARVFGSDEVGIRSLSALIGTLTILVVFAAARRSRPSGRGCSQPAWRRQPAARVVFAGSPCVRARHAPGGGVALALRSCAHRREPGAADLAAWSAVSALALATHYFTVFLIVPMAVLLSHGREGGDAQDRPGGPRRCVAGWRSFRSPAAAREPRLDRGHLPVSTARADPAPVRRRPATLRPAARRPRVPALFAIVWIGVARLQPPGEAGRSPSSPSASPAW